MLKMSLASQLKTSARKGAIVGGITAVLSIVAMDGLGTVDMFGMGVPKFVAQGVVLGTSSVIADFTVPKIAPFMSGGSLEWTRFEALSLTPLLIGSISLGLESVLAPSAEQRGDVLKTIAVGAASSITAAYVSSSMGWSAALS